MPHVVLTPPRTAIGARLALGARVVMALALTFVVYRTAWIADDALITFRYVWNLLHGYGAVFNVGERVQGYTHPLWFVVLAAATFITHDEVYAAIGLSLALTFATVMVLGAALSRIAPDRTTGMLATALASVVLGTSDSWRSFQTSGLEGALSTFLVVLFVVSTLSRAPPAWKIFLAGSLLTLCRPDFALLVVPAGAVALWSLLRDRQRREWHCALAALLPLGGFIVSWVYYGALLPNTGAAKLWIFTLSEGTHQGLLYLRDWFANEPVNALASSALLFFGAARSKTTLGRAVFAGIIVYVIYLIVIGGDFMRGRLLLPVFVAGSTLGALAVAQTVAVSRDRARLAMASAGLLLVVAAATTLVPAQTREISEGIVNERVFYTPGHSLAVYAVTHRLEHNEQFDDVAAYLDACGSVTIRSRVPGALGYYLGPRITLIDTLGLTDRFVAHLPKSTLRYHPPRPGHPYRRIPLAYLAGRHDVSILPGWEDAMRKLDCSLIDRVKPFENDPALSP